MFFLVCYTADSVINAQTRPDFASRLTSNVIQEMGSSSGIAVLLTNLKVNASSSNSTVNIAPGGVHVPIIRWCFIVTADEEKRLDEAVDNEGLQRETKGKTFLLPIVKPVTRIQIASRE